MAYRSCIKCKNVETLCSFKGFKEHVMVRVLKVLMRIKKFNAYEFRDKLLILKAFFITGIIRIILMLVPFNRLKKYIGIYNEESEFNMDNININKVNRIGWAVTKVSRYTIWESKCLVQALTAQKLLYNSGFESTLYFGVSKSFNENKLEAHAWIRCGTIYVTGGNGDKFSVTAKFKK